MNRTDIEQRYWEKLNPVLKEIDWSDRGHLMHLRFEYAGRPAVMEDVAASKALDILKGLTVKRIRELLSEDASCLED
jgi:hypothetical protein